MNYKEEYEKIKDQLVESFNDFEACKQDLIKHKEDDIVKETLESIERIKSLIIVYIGVINKAEYCDDIREMEAIGNDMLKINELLKREQINASMLLLKAKLRVL